MVDSRGDINSPMSSPSLTTTQRLEEIKKDLESELVRAQEKAKQSRPNNKLPLLTLQELVKLQTDLDQKQRKI